MSKLTKDMIPALVRRGVPERTAKASIAAFETDAVVQARGADSLLVLAGIPGVGKSVAALLWLIEKANGKPECLRWVQSGDLARGYAYDQEAFEAIANVYALVVDDLGVEYLDERGRYLCTLEELLSRRFGRLKKTILTTNITDPDLFAERYKERITSRTHEDGAFVVCAGEDLRRAGGRAA
jgi:DNA replication protein DnaC